MKTLLAAILVLPFLAQSESTAPEEGIPVTSAIAVYDRIDYIKVVPDSALARLGSERHPKPLVDKSYLVVTVPAYIQFDQPEVGQ